MGEDRSGGRTAEGGGLSRRPDGAAKLAAGDLELRSYGRRRGRSAGRYDELVRDPDDRQIIIDASRIGAVPVESLFERPNTPLWLEIGFGAGEHLLWQARANPGVNLVGSEPYQDGAAKVLASVRNDGLSNVRVLCDDVRPLVRSLPDGALARVFVLFPDPWPKMRHRKRRLLSEAFLASLARAMKPKAELRVATDIGDYARTFFVAIRGSRQFRWTARSPADWRFRPEDWPETRYERKALAAGRPRYFFSFERVDDRETQRQ